MALPVHTATTGRGSVRIRPQQVPAVEHEPVASAAAHHERVEVEARAELPRATREDQRPCVAGLQLVEGVAEQLDHLLRDGVELAVVEGHHRDAIDQLDRDRRTWSPTRVAPPPGEGR
jgi:phosphoglycolate phosphatase-like HAD superfamily hydrolase